jgi:hypothetical protein
VAIFRIVSSIRCVNKLIRSINFLIIRIINRKHSPKEIAGQDDIKFLLNGAGKLGTHSESKNST